MRRAAADDEGLERGVYRARWTLEGCPVLYAVDEQREKVGEIIVRPDVSEEGAYRQLWRLLDEQDPPRPRLELVR